MKGLKTYFKLQRRMISKTRSRFLSVLIITFIGTAFFSGLRITPKVMNKGADAYLDAQHYADLTLIPTYGATDEDIEAIKKIDGVENVEGTYFCDALLSFKDYQDGVILYSSSEAFNTPYITEGRGIENENECVVDEQYRIKRDLKIGDKIHLKNDETSKEYEIVGFAKDPRYLIYYKRGTNQFGNGSTQGFILLPQEETSKFSLNKDLVKLLDTDKFYNELCIQVAGASELEIYSDEYDELLNGVEADIEDVMTARLQERYDNLIADKKELIKGPLKEYEKGLKDYEKGKAQFDVEIKQAEIALVEGKMQVLSARQQILDAQSQFTDGSVDITGEINGFQGKLDDLKAQLEDLKDKLEDTQTPPSDMEIPDIDDVTDGIDKANQEIKDLIGEITTSIDDLNGSLDDLGTMADGILKLEAGKLALDKAELELELGEQNLILQKSKTEDELAKAKKQLDEAKVQLDEAQAQIDQIPQPTFYLLDQNMNEGVVSFKGDSERIGIIAELFPLLFFLVAALVSLTTMTRMVEEQRTQSGTLRALGYSRALVMMQYISYALFATLIGSVLGVFFGNYIFPIIIYGLYTLFMYDVPTPMIYCFDTWIFVQAMIIAVVVTLVATIGACAKELMSVPAVLMRPKAAKQGKRILLERIPLIWKHLNFNQKVTMRNMFRYKKRFLMSVIGISGCTALMLTGFGIKYSITDMTSRQFEDLWLYDGNVMYDKDYDIEDTETLKEELKNNPEIESTLMARTETGRASGNTDKSIETNLVSPASLNRIDSYFNIRDAFSKEELEIKDDQVIITQKLSELLDLDVGDTLRFSLHDQSYEMVVGAIAENYLQHSIYISQDYYAKVFNQPYQINSAYFNVLEGSEDYENTLGKSLMALDNVYSVVFTDTLGGTFVTQMNSINIVVWVLIISAGLLAFVVLYNLTNININERITEIATIKVLGFRDHEVDDYVFRENILLSILGTMFGLVLGIFLHHYIMGTVEVDYVMFVRTIRPISFVYAAILTMLFTVLINRFMRRVLQRIDMVSSLKSVE